ncbi:uncharacterized protein K452DRAFT_153338 [Aplosporella prunicola CBS 121167]|uniref:Uncharacterized protein n=1 Tax=Aplosporella prunicola CBS 121167 TaxID=1176127 RepID=A0A6A6BJ06_9PEZI|nr:uncharacterized protein K452DRAFT_153338 [Aplosporella prunicola CBS 121167]KAF2144119.1 hypothetical protein K452DRAFT_153338 [Aplosporella prunicola CBS 121167]
MAFELRRLLVLLLADTDAHHPPDSLRQSISRLDDTRGEEEREKKKKKAMMSDPLSFPASPRPASPRRSIKKSRDERGRSSLEHVHRRRRHRRSKCLLPRVTRPAERAQQCAAHGRPPGSGLACLVDVLTACDQSSLPSPSSESPSRATC